MRTLDFNIDRQNIVKASDFSGLIAGTTGYLYARFNFSYDWTGYLKIAIFEVDGKEYPVALTTNICEVPPEAAASESFKVSIVGKRGKAIVPTDRVTVIQRRC